MQAMLLAAGRGARLAPLTDSTPKPLAQLNGRALLDYHLHALAAAGVKRVVINVSWLAELIIEHVGSGRRFGMEIIFSREVGAALETGGGIVQALSWFGDEPFWTINADVYTNFDFGWTQAVLNSDTDAKLLLVDNPPHNNEGDFCLHDDRCLMKDAGAGPALTFAGIALFHPRFFRERPAGRNPLAPWLFEAAQAGRLGGAHFDGTWDDIGTLERLQRRQRMLETAN